MLPDGFYLIPQEIVSTYVSENFLKV